MSLVEQDATVHRVTRENKELLHPQNMCFTCSIEPSSAEREHVLFERDRAPYLSVQQAMNIDTWAERTKQGRASQKKAVEKERQTKLKHPTVCVT